MPEADIKREPMIRDCAGLAIFGGRPLFASPKPVGQLAMPDVDAFMRDVKGVLDSRRLTGGAFVGMLEKRLRELHDVNHCIAVANAGLGLMMLMQIFARERKGEIVMPAFSYRGLPHFAQWAGQSPRFADVEKTTHGLDARLLSGVVNDRTTSILAVNNFNSACDVDALCAAGEELGAPVFFDSVYGLGSTYHGKPLGGNGRAEVFSLHATKLLNGFEGGYVTTNDDELASTLRALAGVDGLNVGLNEIHAAMALRCLDDLDGVVARNRARYEAYRNVCSDLDGLTLIPYADRSVESHNYEMAVVDVHEAWPLTRDEMVKVLRAENVAITSYYSPPLHRGPHAPKGAPAPSLPVSEDLARRFFQLPVGELTSLDDIARLGAFLRELQADGPIAAARLRETTA